jgi:hypothetical protein
MRYEEIVERLLTKKLQNFRLNVTYSPSHGHVCASYIYIHTHIHIYTGCPRMNVPDFGRVFLMLTLSRLKTYTGCNRRNVPNFGRVFLMLTLSRLTIYTGCNRRNVPNFGRVFLMLNYTEKTQNTYTENFKHTSQSLFFSLQNAVYFIMLPCLIPVLFTF